MSSYLNELDGVNQALEESGAVVGPDDTPNLLDALTDRHDETRTLAFSALRDDDPLAAAAGREAALDLAASAIQVARELEALG